jgi:hypothetical protein
MWTVEKGHTNACAGRLKHALDKYVGAGTLKVTHQVSGWCDKNVAISDLAWLRTIRPVGKWAVIWDVYAAHRDLTVKVKARELDIRLIYIPPGMTDKLQPLDSRIFGSLKARVKARVIRRNGGGVDDDDRARDYGCMRHPPRSIPKIKGELHADRRLSQDSKEIRQCLPSGNTLDKSGAITFSTKCWELNLRGMVIKLDHMETLNIPHDF